MIRLHFYSDDEGAGVGDIIGGPQIGVPVHCVVECTRLEAGWFQVDTKKSRLKRSDPFPNRPRVVLHRPMAEEWETSVEDAMRKMCGRKYDKSRLAYCWALRRLGGWAKVLKPALVHYPSRLICTDGPLTVLSLSRTPYPGDWAGASVASVLWHALDKGWDAHQSTSPPPKKVG